MSPRILQLHHLLLLQLGLSACVTGKTRDTDDGPSDSGGGDSGTSGTDGGTDGTDGGTDGTDGGTDSGTDGGTDGGADGGTDGGSVGAECTEEQLMGLVVYSGDPAEDWRQLYCDTGITDEAECLSCGTACFEGFSSTWEAAHVGTSTGWDMSMECGPVWGDGRCCFVVNFSEWAEGRPFRPEGGAATQAPVGRGGGWASSPRPALSADPALRARVAAAWARQASAEHASIGSFAVVTLQLLHLGAPAELLAEAQRAMADEIAHARLSFGLASAWAGAELGPGPLPAAGQPSMGLAEVLRETFVDGCINEGIAAAEAAEAAALCADEATRAVLVQISADEARHAALAWKTLRWLHLERGADLSALRGVLAAERARALAMDLSDAGCPAHGHLGAPARQALALQVLDGVVAPLLERLSVEAPGPSA